jgi:hypothetical protein
MTISLSTKIRNATCNNIVDSIDQGTTVLNGYIEIRDGDRPATPQNSATGKMLATLFFSSPAFGEAVNGTAVANSITADTSINATGIATWFRIYNRNNEVQMDGDITLTGGGGDIEFDDVTFIEGGTAIINELIGVVP